jgi:outer membrane protein assembly factor BamB
LEKEQTSNDFIVWCNTTAGPYNPSTLLVGDLLYVLYDMGFFACLDPKTGEEVYKKQRIPEGKAFTASPWSYGGKIFCLNEDGVTFVIETGKDFKILHTNTLADDDMCMSTPAIVGDRLLVRTSGRIYCIRNGSPAKAGG